MTTLQYGDEAIYALYPQVVAINNGTEPFDAQGNLVTVDWNLIAIKNDELAQQNTLEACKQKASELLYATDWTTIPDIVDTNNKPYLANQADFLAYRNELRKLAVYPVKNPAFPEPPTPVWVNT